MQAIPPALFYSVPPGPPNPFTQASAQQPPPPPPPPPPAPSLQPAIDPSLREPLGPPPADTPNNINASSAAPAAPAGKPARKTRKEFSGKDIDMLLRAVIEVNPFIAPKTQVTAKWGEVSQRVQLYGACLGRDGDTLKNKVKSLLQWVQNGAQKSARCPLGREAEKDPANFASISGKLDKIESMQREAAEVKETRKTQKAQEQNVSRVAGEAMRDAMMLRHAQAHKRKKSEVSDEEEEEEEAELGGNDEDKENEGVSPNSGSRPSSSTPRSGGTPAASVKKSRRGGGNLSRMASRDSELIELQRSLLKEQQRANDISVRRQEASDRHNAAILSVLQTLAGMPA